LSVERKSPRFPDSFTSDSRPNFAFTYSAYGLEIRSNLEIPALVGTAAPDDPLHRVRVHFGSAPFHTERKNAEDLRYISDYIDAIGTPALKIWTVDGGSFSRMAYSDGTEFWLDRELEGIWVRWPERLSVETTFGYLLGPVLGFLLRLRGLVCLHGSVVVIGGSAVVFIGAPGAGKSTTAAAFAQRGFAVLADDIAALEEHAGVFRVFPAYPRVNLWPSSVQLLYGSADALPLIHSSGAQVEEAEKRFLRLGGTDQARYQQRPLPLAAIYVLQPEQAQGPSRNEIIATISKKAAMIALVTHAYGTNVLDAQQRAKEFALLSQLVESVPVRNVFARRNGLTLNALCEAITRDVAQLR
jgi:hypothetical protein